MFEIIELKNYFKKLHVLITKDANFAFFKNSYVDKNKIDDIFCCILAILPESYKQAMRSFKTTGTLRSVLAYNTLSKAIKNKCFFNSNWYQVKVKEATSAIDVILTYIEKDINVAESSMS